MLDDWRMGDTAEIWKFQEGLSYLSVPSRIYGTVGVGDINSGLGERWISPRPTDDQGINDAILDFTAIRQGMAPLKDLRAIFREICIN